MERAERPQTWRCAYYAAARRRRGAGAAVRVVLNAKAGQTVAEFFVGLSALHADSFYSDQWIFNRRQTCNTQRAVARRRRVSADAVTPGTSR